MNSFRLRLTLWYTGVLGGILILFSFVLFFGLKDRLWKNLDPALLTLAQTEISSIVDDPKEGMHLHEFESDIVLAGGLARLIKYVQIIHPDGTVFLHSKNLSQHNLPIIVFKNTADPIQFQTVTHPALGSLRMVSLAFHPPLDQATWTLQLATTTHPVDTVMTDFLWLLLTLATGTLVVTCFGGIFLADRAIKPIIDMTRTAQEISEYNLNLRIEKTTSDEIGTLTDMLNSMLDRLQQAFEALRRFTANASHEIRSPLTILQGEIDVTLRRERTAQEYKEVLVRNREEVQRLSQLATNLLTLARADAGKLELAQEHIDLTQITCDVVDTLSPIAQAKNCQIMSPEQKPIYILGDADALKRVVANLIDNSLHHTTEGDHIEVVTTTQDNQALLSVTDSGSGIAPKDLPHIFERFYRASSTRPMATSGSGLGLAICQEIAHAHGGRLTAKSPPPNGQGTCITLSLPLA